MGTSRIKEFNEEVVIPIDHYKEINDSFRCKEEICEAIVESEILIDQCVLAGITDSENPLKKTEAEHVENSASKKRKRGRPPKDAETEQTQKEGRMSKKNHKLNFKRSNRTSANKDLLSVQENTNSIIEKVEYDTLETDMITASDANDNSDYDTDYEAIGEKKSGDNSRKKRKNPDEKTRKEHDKTIAEYFKIFCSICQIPADNFIALRKHFREEHKKRGFVICCKKKIFTRPILVDHIRFHLDPNFFKCNLCGKVYSDRCTLESHTKTHEDGQQERNHTCDTCGKSFVGSAQLETHKLIHAPDYEKFSCSECGK